MNEALEYACEELRADRVVSVQQIAKLYGVRRVDFVNAGAFTRWEEVRAVGRAAHLQAVEFVSFERRLLKMQPMQLVHYAGTAALRGVLRAPHWLWKSEAGAFAASFEPDALWERLVGETAIEYDTGWYKAKKIRMKAATFEKYAGGQFWGVPTESRVRFVERTIGEAGVEGAEVLLSPWFGRD